MGNQLGSESRTDRVKLLLLSGGPQAAFNAHKVLLVVATDENQVWSLKSVITERSLRWALCNEDSIILATVETSGPLESIVFEGMVLGMRYGKKQEAAAKQASASDTPASASGHSEPKPALDQPAPDHPHPEAGKPDATSSPGEPNVPPTQEPKEFGPSEPESAVPEPGVPESQTPRAAPASRLQMVRASRESTKCSASSVVLDTAGEGEDITALPMHEIEQALLKGKPLPGWNAQGNVQKDLAYVKIFYSARLQNYHPDSLWPPVTFDKEASRLVRELGEQLQRLQGSEARLSEQSLYDIQVIKTWVHYTKQGIVPHGPLLGWARMMGHELYFHVYAEDQPPFLMARVPSLQYCEYPFLDHTKDICEGVKQLFCQAGFWKVPTLKLPVGMALPSMTPERQNEQLLACAWPDGVMSGMIPDGVELRILNKQVIAHSAFRKFEGAPPSGPSSFFFDHQPGRTWYLQARAHWAYAMTQQSAGDGSIKLTWVRRADSPGQQKNFTVTAVMPAEPPSLSGISKFTYTHGLYQQEGGRWKALYLRLTSPSAQRGCEPNVLELFALDKVTEEMAKSLTTMSPAGQGFIPRRSKAGFVVRGERPFEKDPTGWVWQDEHNGPVTMYMKDHFFKQWSQEEPTYYWDPESYKWEAIKEEDGTWHFMTSNDWMPAWAKVPSQPGAHETSQPSQPSQGY
ncbi:unnamed protein product [Effrenium voratum]|nr:unnamed protein product [Effrenium voratum]